jgi:predicted transcriptional regulator
MTANTNNICIISGALLVQQAKCALSMEKAVSELKDKLAHHQQEVSSSGQLSDVLTYYVIYVETNWRLVSEVAIGLTLLYVNYCITEHLTSVSSTLIINALEFSRVVCIFLIAVFLFFVTVANFFDLRRVSIVMSIKTRHMTFFVAQTVARKVFSCTIQNTTMA